ncbi:histidine kinase [Microbacterium sp. HJ5]
MTADPAPHRLTRGVTATWWYTATAVVFLELVLVLTWVAALVEAERSPATLAVVFGGGLVWIASTVPLLLFYRHRAVEPLWARWPRLLAPLVVAAAYGLVAGSVTGVWLMGVLPLIQSAMLLNWPAGVRLRMVVVATLLLGAFCFIDTRSAFAAAPGVNWWLVGFFSVSLPAMSVVSLWWWDVLIRIDRARASEARLAATQERLRVATDVHDLQGHHLQVIALQLELAERLMATDPNAALEQLRAARGSVDQARQGTRDLATRFRSVPLADEIANAADLLSAAGLAVTASVGEGAADAPAAVLGPIIRETTTNVLRHGGGGWARLGLDGYPGGWTYRIANDAPEAVRDPDGAGLAGIVRRVDDAGGTLTVSHEGGEFAVEVRLPPGADAAR